MSTHRRYAATVAPLLLVGVLAAPCAGCGPVSTSVAAPVLAATSAASAAPVLAPVLAPLSAAAPVPTAARVAAALAGPAAAAGLGGGLVGEVLDGPTGRVLWSRSPDAPLLVASTQKLLVAAAALDVLGPGARPTTSLLTTGTVTGSTLTGALVLRGGGDPLLAASASDDWPARASLDQLAADLAARGVRTVRGDLVADGSAFAGAATAPGWKPTYVTEGSVAPVSALELDRGTVAGQYARSPQPALQAATALRAALLRRGVTVTGTVRTGRAAAGATVVASVHGPTTEAGVQEMLQDSDNDAAEAYARRVALATGRSATFAGGASAIVARLTADGLPTAGTVLADASGLSRDDRVTPRLLAAVLAAAAGGRPQWRAILAGLPVADFSGTLTRRDAGPAGSAAAGDVRTKTGNLSGVTAVAGSLVDASGRQLLVVFVTDRAPNLAASEAALDASAAALVPL